MGLLTPNAPVVLQPVNPPIGIHLNYCVPTSTVLVLKERLLSFSGDDFTVKDSNGTPVCLCNARVFSVRDRKVITDLNGNMLYAIHNKLLTFLPEYIGEYPVSREVFRVKKRWGLGTMMETTFLDSTSNTHITLTMQGDMWGGSADIMLGPTVIAQINRSLFNMRQIFGDQQTYYVSVAPGVDLTLIAAMCICFDETKNDRRRR
ncbi:hypothetical protein M231_05216 [Tremella mesenterica]|uniref:Uncharacterized protein n=1 Tax=Tremella mesenterica TaxID=5217 RepID=A0A4Q1BIP7_TREME|nr:hypothetical protein M231_05216 [Tremella mesenterica]